MQPSSCRQVHDYREVTSALPIRALQRAGWMLTLLFASQDFTTEKAMNGRVAQLRTSRLVSTDSRLCSDVRLFGLRARQQARAWEASVIKS